MKKLFLYFTGAILLLTSGCKKDEDLAADTVVFGSFYGECKGERCIEIYKLDYTTQQLSEDTNDLYPRGATPYDGNFVPLQSSLFEQVQGLSAQIPSRLLQQPNQVFGQPDAGDWGGFYLEVNRDGEQHVWLIDTQKQNLPAYLHPLVDQLQADLTLLP